VHLKASWVSRLPCAASSQKIGRGGFASVHVIVLRKKQGLGVVSLDPSYMTPPCGISHGVERFLRAYHKLNSTVALIDTRDERTNCRIGPGVCSRNISRRYWRSKPIFQGQSLNLGHHCAIAISPCGTGNHHQSQFVRDLSFRQKSLEVVRMDEGQEPKV
jgi:hypothetical protein